jgi:hypothetical protein
MTTEELLGSEYDNVSDLLGTADLGAVLSAISRLPKEQHAPVIKKIFSEGDPSENDSSRRELQRRWKQLPKEIRDGLLKQRLQLADTRLYVVKIIAGKNMIDQIQGTDQKNVGLSNLANGKLEKDIWFLISALRLTYGVNADGMEKCDFGHIPPEIRNGEFELECGNKKLIGLMGCDAFDTVGRTDLQIGYYKLESVKVLEPQVEIKMPIKFTAAAVVNSFLKVVFIGTSVIPF